MGFKTITIKEDVYKLINGAKNRGESFSELFERTFQSKFDIMKYAGIWKDMSDKEFNEVKAKMKEFRDGLDKSFKERRKRLGIE